MRIDFAKKTIAGPKHTTPIVSMNKNEQDILLQGTELGYAWTVAIDMQDGPNPQPRSAEAAKGRLALYQQQKPYRAN